MRGVFEQLFLISLVVVFFGGLHWFSFKVLTAVARGAIDVSVSAYQQARQAANWLPRADWQLPPGVVAAVGATVTAGCLALTLVFAGMRNLNGPAGVLPLVALLGMLVSAAGVALFQRRAAGPLQGGERWAVILTVLTCSPFWLVLFVVRD
ncbi:hypothetical protein D3C72_1144520 [compost metagenome]